MQKYRFFRLQKTEHHKNVILRFSFLLAYLGIYEKRKSLFRNFLFGWVAGGTRTHDIQNHNLTL